MANPDDLLVVKFRADKVKNEAKSKEAGRPIFDDIELCEIRSPGDRNTVKVFPAHSQHRWTVNEEGEQEIQTYAQRWSSQYQRFKERRDQIQEGTPLSELPFLTEGKRAELKALSILTAETLAALDGQRLKSIGPGGRELKNQAQAYLDNASGSAAVTKMASEIEALKQQIALLTAGAAPAVHVEPEIVPEITEPQTDEYDTLSDEELKEWIQVQTGARPKGNPNRDTLLRMAREAAPVAA